jgi:metabotropic X receptor
MNVLDVAGNTFRFMNGVDGPPRYSILNYQQDTDGSYRWLVVGNYTRKLKYRKYIFI